MIKKRKPYKTYSKEFKLEAVHLMEGSDRPASEIALELGVRRNQLYKWKSQLEPLVMNIGGQTTVMNVPQLTASVNEQIKRI